MRPRDRRSPVFACRLAEARQIEQEFGGWHVWVSNLGRYWAVRQGPDARCSRDDPRPMTIDGDSANALRAALAEVHAAGDPAELLSTARDDSCRGGLQPSGIVGVMALGPGGTM